ncbi:MAG: aminotransferase class V-fold PLP-dependent enzyme [Acidimicrobiales bacterium]|nr:aminotransferase class V-fold PLP-dependent enzyme [Acidimicrobiales bacterium]
MTDLTPAGAAALDAADPLAGFRGAFVHDDADPDLIYLDGNSLGRLPVASAMMAEDLVRQWGHRLIRVWNEGWFEIAQRIGDRLAELVGAEPGEVVLADSTSIALYKTATAALQARPGRTRILTDDLNFPSDVQALRAAAEAAGPDHGVVILPTDGVHGAVGALSDALSGPDAADVALVSLSQVAFRSGWCWDLADTTRMVHEAGALVLWDLCHSVGVVPIDLGAAEVDLAVGCTYKYLNGGPGSPALLYVNAARTELRNPLRGWLGSDDPMAFSFDAGPAEGASRFLTGTPPVLSAALVEPGVDLTLEAGMDRIWAKSMALTERFIALADMHLAPLGFELRTPRDPGRRGSHVSLSHVEAQAVGQALVNESHTIPDFRPPDLLRFGFAPLYIGYADVDEAVRRIVEVVESGGIDRWRGVQSVVP